MLLTQLHDEPLLHIIQMLHGRDICKLEHTCKRFRHLSFTYDSVVWKNKCRIIWGRKVKDLVGVSEDMTLPITIMDTRDKEEMDALFEQIHVPLHEKVYAFKEVFNMKDSNKLIDKIKKIRKKRKLDTGVSSEDRLKLEPSWKALYSLDYLTDKFHGKYRKKKGPKLYLSPMHLYSPFTVPKSALPMPKSRVANFQTNRFWGNSDEIYYVIKERPEPHPTRSRTNSLSSSGESSIRNFFGGRGRSNSVSGDTHKTTSIEAQPSPKLSSSTNSLPPMNSKQPKSFAHLPNSHLIPNHSSSSSSSTTKTTTTSTQNNFTCTTSTSTTTTTTTTNTTVHAHANTGNDLRSAITGSITNNANELYTPFSPTSTQNSKKKKSSNNNNSNNNNIDTTDTTTNPPTENSHDAFDRPILLPLGHLYFEHRPNGSIDTVGGIWSVVQTRKGRMLVLWKKWRLTCYAEPLMPTKLAYEWLANTAQIQPTSYLALNYEMHGPWHSGKVVSEKLWKMRPWFEQG